MKAFHGDPAFKERFLNELKWHRDQDRMIDGTYGRVLDGKWQGCAVACSWRSLHGLRGDEDGSYHSEDVPLASGLGLPQGLITTLEEAFEVPDAFDGDPPDWAIAFFEAVPVGAEYDESEAVHRLAMCQSSDHDRLAVRDLEGRKTSSTGTWANTTSTTSLSG